MAVVWDDKKYSLGIPAVDRQHKELFAIANRLDKIGTEGIDRRALLSVIKRLHAYASYHFLTEQSLFAQFGYPEEEEHTSLHDEFTRAIRDKYRDAKEGRPCDLSELSDFLASWVSDHIQGEDQKFATYFEDSGAEVGAEYTIEADYDPQSTQESADSLWERRKLALGISKIDNQHKELVYLLQQVSDLNRTGVSDSRVRIRMANVLKRLFYYSQFHFALEESLMSESEYPGLVVHRKVHSDFVARIKELAMRYQPRRSSITDEVIRFLRDWVVDHILGEDTAFKDYLDAQFPASSG